jgi:solute carrier family 25 (mitochondrial phosphate transporter), member 23/24/25/41
LTPLFLSHCFIILQVKGLPLRPDAAASTLASTPLSRISVLEALKGIIHREGVKALWKGNGVTIIHRLPYSAANFWTYETVNEMWKEYAPSQGPYAFGDVSRRLVAGGVAGLTACGLAYPLDLIRTRLAAQTTRNYYHGIGHAFKTIVRDEGAAGLYRGLGATLAQVGPCLAINYAAYETARSAWLEKTDLSAPTPGMSLLCGSFAGLASSTATFPLDLVRRRMQLQGQAGAARIYSSYFGAFKSIATTEGIRGLYSGILPEYYKVVPGVAIAFCAYEMMKRSLDVQTNATDR